MNDKDLVENAIVKAIAYQENGGKPNVKNLSAGKSGELKSIFQFEPNTWKEDSLKVFGKEEPITPDNETYVMKQKVSKWIDEGLNVEQMASIHNSGNPEAYEENHVGVNSYGIKYDTPSYASGVAKYAKQFYQESLQNSKSNSLASNPGITNGMLPSQS